MNQLEGATFKAEEDIVKMSKSVEKAAEAIINAAWSIKTYWFTKFKFKTKLIILGWIIIFYL